MHSIIFKFLLFHKVDESITLLAAIDSDVCFENYTSQYICCSIFFYLFFNNHTMDSLHMNFVSSVYSS